MNKSIIWIVVLIIVLVGGYFLFVSDSEEGSETESPTPSSSEEVSILSKLEADSTAEEVQLIAVDGNDSWVGIAYRLIKDGTLEHAITARLPDPKGENVYEGWLVQVSPLGFFSTGVMEKQSDGTWILEYTGDETPVDYSRVVITEETVVDEAPEGHVLEGDF